jgi:hypothetical protein
MAFDGSIRIDTRVDASGMTKGTKSITSSLSGVMRSLKFLGAAMGVAFSGTAIFNFVKTAMSQFDLMGSSVGGNIKAIKGAFSTLQGAVANLGAAVLIRLTPYIIAAITWLTTFFNTLTAIIQVLFGVAAGMGAVGDETKDTGKDIKKAAGALAAFDQINVLAKKEDTTGGAAAGNALPVLPTITIPDDVLARIQEFKDKLLEFLQPAIDALGRLYIALQPLGETVWAGLKWAWDNILVPLGAWVMNELVPAFLDLLAAGADLLNTALVALQPVWQWIWDNLLKPAAEWTGEIIIQALDWLVVQLEKLSAWIKANPEKFQTFVTAILILVAAFYAVSAIMGVVLAVGAGIISFFGFFGIVITASAASVGLLALAIVALVVLLVTQWDNLKVTIQQIFFLIGYYAGQLGDSIKSVFMAALEFVRQKFMSVWIAIQSLWMGAGSLFTTIGIAIREAFGTSLDFVREKFTEVFGSIKDFVRGVINNIIGSINGMIGGIVSGINAIVGAYNAVGSAFPDFSPLEFVNAPEIPYLAKGAVIPPNSQFAAILGDQKSGTNIEAPADLIRQIVREEIQGAGGSGEITVNMPVYLDSEKIYDGQQKVSTRRGTSLIKSGVTA